MLTPEQKEFRHGRITATRARDLWCARNPSDDWSCSEADVFLRTLGLSDGPQPNENMRYGERAEALIAQEYQSRMMPDGHLCTPRHTVCCEDPQRAWAACSPDGYSALPGQMHIASKCHPVHADWIKGIARGVEIKAVCSQRMYDYWGGKTIPIPPEPAPDDYFATVAGIAESNADRLYTPYILQCQWSMVVTGLPEWDVFAQVWGYGGPEYRCYRLKANAKIQKGLMGMCGEWHAEHIQPILDGADWREHMERQGWPLVDGSKASRHMLRLAYPDHDEDIGVAMGEDLDLMEEDIDLRKQIGALKERRAEVRNALEARIGKRQGLEAPDGSVRAKITGGGLRVN